MAQHDYDIANADGATVRADLNALFEAVGSNNAGATAPSTTFPFMRWADTANSLLKQRNSANTAWRTIGAIENGELVPYSEGVPLRRSELVAVTATAFVKSDGSQPAWTAPTATTLEAASALSLVVGSTIVEIAAGASVTLPALSAGTDYTIYASDAGALQAVDADSAAPAGERVVGGFHASAGAGEVVTRSLWDLNWRPNSSPRAMVLSLDGRVWADIYLCDVDYALNGFSRSGQTIADDGNRPAVPAEYGGDGTTVYGSASWWSFNDVMSSAGKRFPSYQEFTALAYGVVERQAVGTDPGTTQHQAGHRSACGAEQATGVMWQFGADVTGTSATGSTSWLNLADGRGDIFTGSIRSPVFGGHWNVGSNTGSRASGWSFEPDDSSGQIGARGVCDHINLQGER